MNQSLMKLRIRAVARVGCVEGDTPPENELSAKRVRNVSIVSKNFGGLYTNIIVNWRGGGGTVASCRLIHVVGRFYGTPPLFSFFATPC